jgi:hypothetical protein
MKYLSPPPLFLFSYIAAYFKSCISQTDLDELNIEIIRNALYKVHHVHIVIHTLHVHRLDGPFPIILRLSFSVPIFCYYHSYPSSELVVYLLSCMCFEPRLTWRTFTSFVKSLVEQPLMSCHRSFRYVIDTLLM